MQQSFIMLLKKVKKMGIELLGMSKNIGKVKNKTLKTGLIIGLLLSLAASVFLSGVIFTGGDGNHTIRAYINDTAGNENQLSQKISAPKIKSASVEPSKVRPGDTMIITAEIEDNYGISSVIADIGGIETIELELINGSLYQGTWQGDWLVHNTEQRDYITTITATNIKGLSSSVEVEWSDPTTITQYATRYTDNPDLDGAVDVSALHDVDDTTISTSNDLDKAGTWTVVADYDNKTIPNSSTIDLINATFVWDTDEALTNEAGSWAKLWIGDNESGTPDWYLLEEWNNTNTAPASYTTYYYDTLANGTSIKDVINTAAKASKMVMNFTAYEDSDQNVDILLDQLIINVTYTPNQAPNVTMNSTSYDTTDTTPDVNFTATDDSNQTFSCTVYFNGTAYGTNSSVQNNTLTNLESNTSLSDSTYTVYVNCTDTDSSQKTGQSSSIDIGVDTTSPTISYNPTTTQEGNYSQNWIFINVTASDTNKDTVLFEWNGTNETFDNQSGDVYWENKTSLSDGTYTIKAYINDTAGNTNQTETRTINLDTTPPEINFTDPTTEAGNHFQDWISANVTAPDSGVGLDTINLTLYNSTGLYQENTTSDTQIYINYTDLPEDTYYLNATANDTLGNIGQKIRTITLDTTNPVLNFTPPTEPNGTTISRNWTEANITIDELNLDTFKFNWNTTNYTFYDDSLVLGMNFNNNSAIGENETKAVDISKYGNNGTIAKPSDWWNDSFKYRKKLTITNNNATNLTAGDPINFTLDTASLVSAGKLLANGDDLRIIHVTTEINRTNSTEFNSSDTMIWFNAQDTIGNGDLTSDYYVYYGNSEAGIPNTGGITTEQNYDLTVDKGEESVIRAQYVDGKFGKALSFDGLDDYVDCGNDSSLDITDAITVESWMNPLDAWAYKKPITLDPATPETDYQVKVELNTTNFDYSHAQSDGDDLRFYQSNGTKLNYWLEKWNTTGNSTIWVKVATNNTDKIYMYYGNPSATYNNTKGGANTFEFFDDFNLPDGSLPDSSKWNHSWTDGSSEIINGELNLSVTATADSWVYEGWKTFTKLPRKVVYETNYRFEIHEQNYMYQFGILRHDYSGDDRDYYDFTEQDYYDGIALRKIKGSTSTAFENHTHDPDSNWHSIKLLANESNLRSIWDNNITLEGKDDEFQDPYPMFIVAGSKGAGNTITVHVDDIRVRKYTSTEPNATVGNETAAGISKAGSYGIGANTTTAFASINNETIAGAISSGWNHITQTYNSSEQKLYVNGELKTSQALTGSISTNTNNLLIGDYLFNGTIDEVRIYNRALSPDEIKMHYKSEFSKFNSTQYRFYDNVTDLADGTYTYYGWANDTASNEGQTDNNKLRYLNVDTTPPTISIIYPDSNSITNNYIINGTSTDLTLNYTNISIKQGGTIINSTTNSSEDWEVHLYAPDGTYNITATAYDGVGYSNSTTNTNITIAVPPEIQFVTPTTETGNQTETWISANVTVSDTNLDTLTLNLYNSTGLYQENTTSDTQIYINYTDLARDTYYLNATANDTAGNENKTETREIKITALTISVHETDNSSDKSWNINDIPLNFQYYCYAGVDGSCNSSLADDGDGSTCNFTIENNGSNTVDILMYALGDYSSSYYICSSSDSTTDGDDSGCQDPPAIGANGADNIQIYNSSAWFNVSSKIHDGDAYGMAVACDLPANTNLSDIDFQVRVPDGVAPSSYSATLQFVAYSDISGCSVGSYFVP